MIMIYIYIYTHIYDLFVILEPERESISSRTPSEHRARHVVGSHDPEILT